jgi:GntR family transcriptional regulator
MNSVMPLPKYHQVYLVLREQLHEGKFAQGLPGELALMQQFAVARVTVRRALSQLAQEGLISREPGRGTRSLLQRKTQTTEAAPRSQQAKLKWTVPSC